VYFAHVVGTTDAFKPAFLVEQGLNLIIVHTGGTAQIEVYSWIHVTTTGTHDQPFEGCHAHGGIDALTLLNCSRTGAITQVQRNQIE
jgi:hypothetical protein